MATLAPTPTRPRATFAPDTFERVLAIGAVVLTIAVLAALARGYGEWSRVPPVVWIHLATIMIALALTPTMLLRPRGDRLHRRLGRVWAVAMIGTAGISLFIHGPTSSFSIIHILSVWTLIQVPIIWSSARNHNVVRHRRAVRGMVFGALLIAGFFTFPFDRLLGHWLFAGA